MVDARAWNGMMPIMQDTNRPDDTFDARALADALREILDRLPDDPATTAIAMPERVRLQMRRTISELLERLSRFNAALDPIRQPPLIFDPSDPDTIGRLIAQTLLAQSRVPLGEVEAEQFYGSGVYAIYYRGDFEAYQPVSHTETPVYVGKVDPQQPSAETAEQQGRKLYQRLAKEHLRSIRAAENLEVDDFDCRYLVVKSAWQTTAETYLIHRFRPIWNNEVGICYGIGKHGDSAATRRNKRSPWDTLHPGRKWASAAGNIENEKSPSQILDEIAEHYRKHPPT